MNKIAPKVVPGTTFPRFTKVIEKSSLRAPGRLAFAFLGRLKSIRKDIEKYSRDLPGGAREVPRVLFDIFSNTFQPAQKSKSESLRGPQRGLFDNFCKSRKVFPEMTFRVLLFISGICDSRGLGDLNASGAEGADGATPSCSSSAVLAEDED